MLVCTLLEENREKLLTWAAGKSVHHNIRGGLLYHTYTMLQSASQLYKVYKTILPLDRDLLFAGVILHDIGKVRELSCSSIMSIDYTPDGNLLGHLFIGAEMVGECARKLGLPEEKTLLLQHMLLSHHGNWKAIGRPIVRCFPIMEKGKWVQSHCRQSRKHPSCITLTAWMLRCTCSGQQGKKQNREKCLTGYSPWTAGCTIQKIEFEFTFLCLRKGAFFYEI